MSVTVLIGLVVGVLAPALAWQLFRATTIEVEDEHAVLVTSHGRLVATLTTPGLVFFPRRALPWVDVRVVSLARDFREILDVHVHDVTGTAAVLDLWVELRIVDPAKALFGVDDWERALTNVVTHATLSAVGTRDFFQLLVDREELGARIRADVQAEATRWGLAVEDVLLEHVGLPSELTRQVFASIAARLELAKAQLEEEGRLAVALLEAQTSAKVADLVAEAKGQYPRAIGRALGELRAHPRVFEAYNALYALNQLRPHRTTAFVGFEPGELRAVDAAMFEPEGARAAMGGPAHGPAALANGGGLVHGARG